MTEIFDALSVAGDPVTEEDRVVHLLASFPDSYSMLVCHALSAGTPSDSWIVDSRATCHMCNNVVLFVELRSFKEPLQVTLDDGHALQATGRGNVVVEMKLPDGVTKTCKVVRTSPIL